MDRIFERSWLYPLLTLLTLATTGAAWAAGGTYDEDDPFDEAMLFEQFQKLGGDLTKEQDIEFTFTFRDRIEERAENAQQFANKLRFKGYPKAEARPCGREDACWVVIAPKRVRLDLKKNIALSKELDQLAADYYGRYSGWDCAEFKRDMQRVMGNSSNATALGTYLTGFNRLAALQCDSMQKTLAAESKATDAEGKRREAVAGRSFTDMICSCMPERVTGLLGSLPPAELTTQLSEAEFNAAYNMPKIVQPCAARMMRKMYGEDCPDLAAGSGLNVERYCGCMSTLVNGMSEAEIAELGLISSDYLPKVAQAKKSGNRPPDPPPLFAKFAESEGVCRK